MKDSRIKTLEACGTFLVMHEQGHSLQNPPGSRLLARSIKVPIVLPSAFYQLRISLALITKHFIYQQR